MNQSQQNLDGFILDAPTCVFALRHAISMTFGAFLDPKPWRITEFLEEKPLPSTDFQLPRPRSKPIDPNPPSVSARQPSSRSFFDLFRALEAMAISTSIIAMLVVEPPGPRNSLVGARFMVKRLRKRAKSMVLRLISSYF